MDMMAGRAGATAADRARRGQRYGSAIAVDAGHLLIPGYVG
jgi:hypothetical protein